MAKTLSQKMDNIHEQGVKRHAREWLAANQAAINAAGYCDFDYSTPEGKVLISRIVLHVLDVVLPQPSAVQEGGQRE